MNTKDWDNLDRLLSERLKKAVGGGKRKSWRDVRRRAGERKLPRWSKRRILIAAALLLVAIGAAAGATTSIIPWLEKEPETAPPPDYPICRGGDIEAKMYLHRLPAGPPIKRPGVNGTITFVNTGEPDCALKGDPRITLVGANAGSVPLRIKWFDGVESIFSPAAGQNRAPWEADQTLIGRVYEPYERSFIHLWWENWCGPGADTDGWKGKPSLRIELPNGTRLVLPIYRLPACTDRTKPSILRIDQAISAPPPAIPALPLHAEILEADNEQPFHLQPGKVFHFTVGLTNTGSSTFRFGKCPTYYEGLHLGDRNTGEPVGFGRFVLNCDPRVAIRPGETLKFAMQITPFEDAWGGGMGELVWELGPEKIGARRITDPPTAAAHFVIDAESTGYSPNDRYSIFSPELPEAVFPPSIEKTVSFVASPKTRVGPVVEGSRRILLKEVGSKNSTVYAFLTESGNACYTVNWGASCDGGQKQKAEFAWILSRGQKGPIVISGLIRDGIKGLTFVIDGDAHAAVVGRNAFYLEIASEGEWTRSDLRKLDKRITGFVITKEDGSKETITPDELGCMKDGCVLG